MFRFNEKSGGVATLQWLAHSLAKASHEAVAVAIAARIQEADFRKSICRLGPDKSR
jgi:hypothetical protein